MQDIFRGFSSLRPDKSERDGIHNWGGKGKILKNLPSRSGSRQSLAGEQDVGADGVHYLPAVGRGCFL